MKNIKSGICFSLVGSMGETFLGLVEKKALRHNGSTCFNVTERTSSLFFCQCFFEMIFNQLACLVYLKHSNLFFYPFWHQRKSLMLFITLKELHNSDIIILILLRNAVIFTLFFFIFFALFFIPNFKLRVKLQVIARRQPSMPVIAWAPCTSFQVSIFSPATIGLCFMPFVQYLLYILWIIYDNYIW